ncbi:MAG: hypothetical protein RLZZ603_681 [Actinomycetota bacterium]
MATIVSWNASSMTAPATGGRPARPAAQITVTEVNILEDATLAAKHAEEIPVVLIDGQMHSYWRIDAERLTKKLKEATDA